MYSRHPATWSRGALGRGLAVVGVQVPRPARGLFAVHQQVVVSAHVPVEVFQSQIPGGVRPSAERVRLYEETARRQDLHLLESSHEAKGAVGRGVMDGHGRVADGSVQAVTVGLRLDVAHPVTELGRAVPHGGQEQVRLGTAEVAPAEDPTRLDHNDLAVRAQEMRAHLITKGFSIVIGRRRIYVSLPPRGDFAFPSLTFNCA